MTCNQFPCKADSWFITRLDACIPKLVKRNVSFHPYLSKDIADVHEFPVTVYWSYCNIGFVTHFTLQ